VDAALLRYAQAQATTWGAERFATEFRRRELEERWIEAASAHTTPYSPEAAAPGPDACTGPVEAGVQDATIGADGGGLRLSRPTHGRHPSVPRPPAPEPEPDRRRRFRRADARSSEASGWSVSPAEAARMSAAGRRLYGLDDPQRPTR
jgi:hypothetical protein